jgi:DNA-binding NtrC family response regulator
MPKTVRALIVEDSEDDAELLHLELLRGGFVSRCRRVTSAEEMLAALQLEPWEIVLSDYALPGFDAIGALRLLRESGLDLPFIVVSGAISEEVAVELMRLGACDYIFKGNLRRLPAAVARELRESENRRARRRAEQVAQQLAAVVQSSNAPIVSETLEGVVTSWNPAAEQLCGWSASEVVGRQTASFFVPPERLHDFEGLMERSV